MGEQRLPPVVYSGFPKGITDYYVDCDPGYARMLDNLLLTPQGKPYLRCGSIIWNTASPVLTNAEACDSISRQWLTRDKSIFFQWAQNRCYQHAYDASVGTPTAFAAMLGQGGDGNLFVGAGSGARHYVSQVGEQQLIAWEKSYLYGGGQPMKTYLASATTATAVTAGVLTGDGTVTFTPGTAGAAVSYIYYLVYDNSYTSYLNTSFLSLGAPSPGMPALAGLAIGPGAGAPMALSAIPSMTIASLGYATGNCHTRIYRTTNGGTLAYLVTTLARGVTTYSDTTTDATLVTRTPLYTNDGTSEYGLPPSCRYAVYVNGQGYYGHGVQSTINLVPGGDWPQRFWQSIPGIFDAVPGSYFIDFEKPITALSSYDVYPMVFLKDRIYRVEGVIGALGDGEMVKRQVSGSVGCDCMAAIVSVGRNLYFPAQDGFYVCNGYTVEKISAHLNATYATWTSTEGSRRGMTGAYNPGDNRIYWSISDPNIGFGTGIVVLDLNFPTEGGGVFTTWSDPQSGGMSVSAMAFLENGSMLRAHANGYLFKHNQGSALNTSSRFRDPMVNTGTSSTTWAYGQVIPQIWTSVTSFGDKVATKWSSEVFCRMRGVDIDGQSTKQHIALWTEINRNNVQVPLSQFHVATQNGMNEYAFRRMFPALTRRCQERGMIVSVPWSVLITSETGPTTATVTGTNTVALSSGSWTTDIEDPGYGRKASIYFEADGYVAGYPILTRSGGTITVSGSPANRAGSKWVIRGYNQDQPFNFEALELPYLFHGGASNIQATGLTGVRLPP